MSRRFFSEQPLREGAAVEFARGSHADELKHLRKALRLAAGDRVVIVDGQGGEADAEITALDSDSAALRVLAVRRLERARPRIILAQGLLKGQRMDWLIEKATELGADSVVAVLTRFAVPTEEEAAGRGARWQRIARAALKQCESPFLPNIVGPIGCAEYLAQLGPPRSGESRVFLHPGENNPALLTVLGELAGPETKAPDSLLFVLGPEGGFHPEEVVDLEQGGFRAASLGSSILRGEPAALTALAVAKQWSIADNNY